MKKLLLLSVLLMAVILNAQVSNGFELRLDRFFVNPTDVGQWSYYDYSHGSYDGFPIRIQGDDVVDRGIYMTFMNQATMGQNRRQRLAFANMSGNVLAYTEFYNGTAQEGFGTLAIDHGTGNPFFAWHVNQNPATLKPEIRLIYDTYNYSYDPGSAISEQIVVFDNAPPANRPPHPSSSPTVRNEEFEFLWPVIFIGPSPIDKHQRVYVFMSNSGSTWKEASGTTNGYMPSSAKRLAFADVKFITDDSSPDFFSYVFNVNEGLIWSVKVID
ncbi:MAG: hypothetical protein FWG20_03075, partial [Candidatus Cloacimonetes bacterium]|nr:hypothetical protein [Candidatus Cloacimonadota bacterium]